MNDGKAILVWRFEDAPKEFRDLSDNGGDEDWVALVPPCLVGEWISWLDNDAFGCYKVLDMKHPSLPGYSVRIGCHA